MKNTAYTLFISLLFFVIAQAVMADAIKDADVIYKKCMDKAGYNDFNMGECIEEHTDNLKKHLNKLWQALITEHNNAIHEMDSVNKMDWVDEIYKKELLSSFQNLQEEQKKWEEYEKAACNHFNYRLLYGTAGILHSTGCHNQVIMQRIEDLQDLFCMGRSSDDNELCAYKDDADATDD